ncbi:hypothetical protein BDR07DRAFT_1494122 [Suillus spraguei]|nr:hypothetical protein BDR07DRAFT_1494122 [Suillus spraguei]
MDMTGFTTHYDPYVSEAIDCNSDPPLSYFSLLQYPYQFYKVRYAGSTFLNRPTCSIVMVNQPTANDTALLAGSALVHSDVLSSPQSIADNQNGVKLILPQVKATPSELHSAAPEVIDVDENNTAPAAKQDDEADLATSTAVEHVFSQGWHLLHFTQNSPEDLTNIMKSLKKRKQEDKSIG